jgi:hypothetical protein
MMVVGSDMIRSMERELPARFGAKPGDIPFGKARESTTGDMQ